MLLLFTLPAWTTVVTGSNQCPVQFEGRVKEIIEPIGANDIFSVYKVVFENLKTLKGEIPDQLVVEVLQKGPFKLNESQDYKVQLRNGRVCWIEEI